MRRRAIARWSSLLALASWCVAAQAAIPVYDATQISARSYRVVKRLWGESWLTALDTPRDASREAALQRLLRAAEEAGADAVVNVYCLPPSATRRGHYCYGNAVRLTHQAAFGAAPR